MNTELATTLRIEHALRIFARGGFTVGEISRSYRLGEGELQVWLNRFNRGSRKLELETIDRVKRELGGLVISRGPRLPAPAPKPPPERAEIRQKSAPRPPAPVKPSLLPIPPERSVNGEAGKSILSNLAGPAGDWIPKEKIVSFLVEVGPELAETWLLQNVQNRVPSRGKIRRFAASIAAGRWEINGETIKFSKTGKLLDGQSRLRAVLQAGRPTTFEIRLGLPEDAQKTMDVGEVRKTKHQLQIAKELYPEVLGPALRLLWLAGRNQLSCWRSSRGAVFENFDVLPILERHPGIRAAVKLIWSRHSEVDPIMPSSRAAFFFEIFGSIDPKLRDKFFTAFFNPKGGPVEALPARLMTKKLIEDKATARSARTIRRGLGLPILAWNYMRDRQMPKDLQLEETDRFPEIDGLARQNS